MNEKQKKVLYIVSPHIYISSPVGIRIKQWEYYLNENNIWELIGNKLKSKYSIIFRLWNYIIKKFNLALDTSFFLLPLYIHEIKKKLKENDFDIVLIQTLPFSFYYLCPIIKKINPTIQIVVDMSDPLVINSTFSTMTKMRQRKLEKIELKWFSLIDYLIVLNNEIKAYYLSLTNPPKNCIVLEQGIDIDDIKFNSDIPLGNKNPVIFMYAGIFYKIIREPFALFDTFMQTDKNIRLILYSQYKFNSYFLPPKHDNIIANNLIPHLALMEEYKKCNVIVFLDNKNSYQIPGKLFEILALQKPILFIYANENSPSLHYVRDEKGVFLSLNNKRAIDSCIKCIIEENKSFYSRDINIYTWENLFHRLDFLFKN